ALWKFLWRYWFPFNLQRCRGFLIVTGFLHVQTLLILVDSVCWLGIGGRHRTASRTASILPYCPKRVTEYLERCCSI
ncbi:hypothetical protein KC19_VG036200, partial [Ceratodon purpureus]